MANLIMVAIKMTEGGSTLAYETLKILLKQVFPDYDPDKHGGWKGYNGVEIRPLSSTSVYSSFLGLTMSAGDSPKERRRVMVKNGMIDADAIMSKYNELKKVADDTQAKYQISQEYQSRVTATHINVLNDLGITENIWRCGISQDTPDTVSIEGYTDWRGLKLISDTLGKTIRVKIAVTTPPDKAQTVYGVLKPEDSH